MKTSIKYILSAVALASLIACGGGDGSAEPETVAQATDAVEVVPAYHRLPAMLDDPTEEPVEVAEGDTKELIGGQQMQIQAAGLPYVKPAAAVVYNPAQIRAAYKMPAIPADLTRLTAEQAASLGAGQTIYIVTSNHNPNIVKDMNLFSDRWGLPRCTEVAAPAKLAALPAAGRGCTVTVAYSKTGPALSAAAPAYSASWSQETALDTQWAHAVAPLARIVVIEAVNSVVTNMMDAVRVANTFGPGVVSMSWAAGEGSYVLNASSIFLASGMTYLAAAGDWGSQVNWPAVDNKVTSVGGTSLSIDANGNRGESAWAKSGGGVSLYMPRAYWQAAMPRTGGNGRIMNDVSFNADPYTGQYVTVTTPGSTKNYWYSFGGTSVGTPQWAGIVAVANAMRATRGLAPLGNLNNALYLSAGAFAGAQGAGFNDVAAGANGTCPLCKSGTGWDLVTGWGTPNVSALLSYITVR